MKKKYKFIGIDCNHYATKLKQDNILNHKNWEKELLILATICFIIGFFIPRQFLYITFIYYLLLYLLIGTNVLLKTIKNIQKGNFFDENFLMTIATLGAFFLGEFPEAVAVMLFYQIGEYLQERAVDQSRRSIAQLMDIRPDKAWKIEGDEIVQVKPEMVTIGDSILVKPGEKVPLDGRIKQGHSSIDTSALTGESLPKDVGVGEEITSGVINLTSSLVIEVTKPFAQSTVHQILKLVEEASHKKAQTERIITRFSRIYTPLVVGLAILIAVLPPSLGLGTWASWFYRSLTFLVISCPCALVVSVPLSFFRGLGVASRIGVLIKGGNYLEVLANLDTIIFDKTGTLTEGQFTIQEIVAQDGDTNNILRLATHIEIDSNHPIALSLKNAYGTVLDNHLITDIKNIPGKGLVGTYEDSVLYLGNQQLMKSNGIDIPDIEACGTILYLAKDSHYIGHIRMSDQIKETSSQALKKLKKIGVHHTAVLSGDKQTVVDQLANQLAITTAYGECLPQEKSIVFEKIKQTSQKSVAFVGDGINDAPVLALSDVGIAMGALGSDAAIEAADVVIMDDNLTKLPQTILLARKTLRIAKLNILLAIGVKFLFLSLSLFGLSNMWEAIFADVGMTLIAIVNSYRIRKI